MHKLTHRLAVFAILIFTLLAQGTVAAYQRGDGYEFQNDLRALSILFVNGIKNTEDEAIASSESLIDSLYAQGLPAGKYNVYYFHNKTDGPLDDSEEVAVQVRISDTYLQLAAGNRETYYKLLGQHYNRLAENAANLPVVQRRIANITALLSERMKMGLEASAGLVVVPHSQGNLYVEAAYAMLLASGRSDLTSKIRVVGVAPASATTPSDRYILSSRDVVITETLPLLAISLSTFKPLPANVIPCTEAPPACGRDVDWKKIDPEKPNGHGFVTVYLNKEIKSSVAATPLPRTVYNLIVASLAELGSSPPPPSPSEYRYVGEVASTGVPGLPLGTPTAVAISPINGDLYITELSATLGSNRVLVFDKDGIYKRTIGGQYSPTGIGINPTNGEVYVTDSYALGILRFDSQGSRLPFGGSGPISGPNGARLVFPAGIAVSRDGQYLMVSGNDDLVWLLRTDGTVVRILGGAGSADGQFNSPGGVALDQTTGNFYVADRGNGRVQVLDSTGSFLRSIGTPGTGDGQFERGQSVAIDAIAGRVFVGDTTSQRIQVFSLGGLYLSQFGTPGTLPGQFDGPSGIAVSSFTRQVFVVDRQNRRVQVFTASN